nr:hypothetical protein [uncultured Cohaesibacter sp.]
MFRLAFLLLLLMTGFSVADDKTYFNGRFGTSATIPAGFVRQPGPKNGDGHSFESQWLEGRISVYGSYGAVADSFKGYRQYLTNLYGSDGKSITYKTNGDNWFVLSGWSGDRIYYLRVVGCNNGPMHHMYFEYAGDQNAQWSPIIKNYSKTLTGPCQ